jgi:hypothetical protein
MNSLAPSGSRARLLSAALVALVILAGMAAIALTTDRGTAPAGATDVDPRITAVLSVFDGPRTADDELDFDPTAPDGTGDVQPGERPDLARRISLPDGGEAFVWPMDEGVCYASPGGNGCIPIAVVREKGFAVGSQQQVNTAAGRFEDVTTFGLVRDGIPSVVLHFEDGTTQPVEVADNAFVASDRDDIPVAIGWTDADGQHRVATGTDSPSAVLDSIREGQQAQQR